MDQAADTGSTLTVLVVTARPPILTFFEALAWHGDEAVTIEHALPAVDAVDALTADAPAVAVAVVDVALDAASGTQLSRRIRERRADVPVIALVCCPFCVTSASAADLLAAGVSGIVDLRATSREMSRMLRGAVRGETVLHLRLDDGALLRDALAPVERRTEFQRRLLELVAKGLPDREIGGRLHLSPHTVKHHLDALRREIGARNRIELAAWAGRNGFYARNARSS